MGENLRKSCRNRVLANGSRFIGINRSNTSAQQSGFKFMITATAMMKIHMTQTFLFFAFHQRGDKKRKKLRF